MARTADVGAVVVGGGIAGLAAGLALQRRVREVVVLDASDRPGGVMRTDHVHGYVVERGPNTFQVKPPLLAQLREEALEDALLAALPESRKRFVFHQGRLVAAPLSPLGLARTPLLGFGAKLRLLLEPLVWRRDGRNESVAEFVSRRLGRQVTTNLVAPFLTGVYAGDEEQLGAEPVLGPLVRLERRFGSIALGGTVTAVGALLRALVPGRRRGLRGSYSAREGLGPFARRLAERLFEPPGLGARVRELSREGDIWRLTVATAAGESDVRAERVVLAVPAAEAAELLRPLDPEAAKLLDGILYAPIVALPLGLPRDALRRPAEGFGFLAPRDAGLDLLGCLYMSRLFPGRAPQDHELLHCMLGGMRHPEALDTPDDLLRERALADLDRVLGVAGEAQDLGIARWPRAVPQPAPDHLRRVAEIRERLAAFPNLAVAGSWVAGVSIADTFASGLHAANL